MRLLEADHRPDSWPAVRMRDISTLLAEIDRLTNRLQWHGPGCVTWGPRHYECLLSERTLLRQALEEADRLMDHCDEPTDWRDKWASLLAPP